MATLSIFERTLPYCLTRDAKKEGVTVNCDAAVDFAVLRSNCHRMIHRFSDPSDLAAFRKTIKTKTVDYRGATANQ
jgi:hypothetical protein